MNRVNPSIGCRFWWTGTLWTDWYGRIDNSMDWLDLVEGLLAGGRDCAILGISNGWGDQRSMLWVGKHHPGIRLTQLTCVVKLGDLSNVNMSIHHLSVKPFISTLLPSLHLPPCSSTTTITVSALLIEYFPRSYLQ